MWTSQEKGSRGMGILSPKSEELYSVQMSISQAPLSFRQPVTQKKAFYPPFKVQVSASLGNSGSQIPMKVNAYSLTEDGLVSFLKQVSHNRFPALSTDTGLQNSCIYKCIENRESDYDSSSFYVTETFEFADMYFKSSSRMGLRWLLFVARVHGDLLCLLYKYPTIVLSRKTDQYSKACSILAKSNPVMDLTDRSSGTCSRTSPLSISSNERASETNEKVSVPVDTQQWILAAYGECHFPRRLTQRDLSYLEASLGLSKRPSQTVPEVSATEEERKCFETFAKWYLACLLSLKKEHELWCSTGVAKLCPFSVDRAVAEQLLLDQQVGTFLVRISSEPGCFVLSIKEANFQGAFVDHFLIDPLDLKELSLSAWIMQNQRAHIFFDINTGRKFPKQLIFMERINLQPPKFMNFNASYHQPENGLFSKDLLFRSTDSEAFSFECL
eukprot:g238.t1